MLRKIGLEAREASKALASASGDQKNQALKLMSKSLMDNCDLILDANKQDLKKGKDIGISEALTDRLTLTNERIQSMAAGLLKIVELEDPVGKVEKEWTGENGLEYKKIRFPFGVIGVIYEARPNVTSDVGGLCLKSGNASILRGSSYCLDSNKAVLKSLKEGLSSSTLPPNSIQLLEDTSREKGIELMKLTEFVDLN